MTLSLKVVQWSMFYFIKIFLIISSLVIKLLETDRYGFIMFATLNDKFMKWLK